MESGNGIVKSAAWRDGVGALGRALLDQLFPPVCLACADAVGTPDGLCPSCWRQLAPITAPFCPVLGIPLPAGLGPDALSAQALADPPPYRRARAAVAYNEVARRLVSLLKYADRPEIALFCGRLMAAAAAELAGPDAVLVPVPLHRMRQWKRRYNQSTELARVLARLLAIPLETGLVYRARHTPQQVGLSARQRARNVAGAFAVRPDAALRASGRRIVLVDDVVTTGATVTALARSLRRSGLGHVEVISFARVVPGADMSL